MDFALFSMEGWMFLNRWLHVFFAIIWIGHLYYFNFVQGAFFNETDATTKSNAIQKLVPRALWWFRYGALFTLITGLLLFIGRLQQGFSPMTPWGVQILIGMMLGITMAFNVWFIIWPNQRIVIASATQVAQGGQALPNAAACGAKAGLASRHNVLFSIPMIFFMTSARNLNVTMTEGASAHAPLSIALLIILVLEFNALKGKLGVLTTIKGVVTWGFILAFGLYALVEVML
jgi:uncharacterized membrane protein